MAMINFRLVVKNSRSICYKAWLLSFCCLTSGLLNVSQAQDLKLVIPQGHTNPVTHIAVSPDKKFIASTDGTNQFTLWDFEAARQISRYPLANTVSAIYFGDDFLFIGLRNGNLLRFSRQTFELSPIENNHFTTSIVAMLPQGEDLLVVAKDGKVKSIKSNGQATDSLALGLNITCGLLHHSTLFLGTPDGHLIAYDLAAKKTIKALTLDNWQINDLAISPSGRQLAASDNRGQVFLVDAAGLTLVKTFQTFSLRARGIVFTGENSLLVVGRDAGRNIKSIALTDGQIAPYNFWSTESDFPAFPFGLYAVERPDNNTLLFSGYQQNFWRVDSLGIKTEYRGEASRINKIALDSTGTRLAIASNRGQITIIDLTGSKNPRVVDTQNIPTSLKWAGSTLYAGLANGQILRLTGNKRSTFSPPLKSDYPETVLDIDKTGQLAVRKYNAKTLSVIGLEKNKVVKSIKKAGYSYRFHPQQNRLFVLNAKKQIEVWSASDLKKIKTYPLKGIAGFTLSADGAVLAARLPNKVALINTATGTISSQFAAKGVGRDQLYLSPKADKIYRSVVSRKKGSTRTEYYVMVLDAVTGKEITRLTGHAAQVTDIGFVKNGNYVLTASADGTIKVWDKDNLPLGNLVPLQQGNYVIVAESGLFDATQLAMDKLSYLQGTEAIQLNQVKERYYEPGLLPKLLGFNKEPLREVEPLNHIKLYPEFELTHPVYNDGKLGIKVSSREGGVGRIIILINGKEVNSNVRASSAGVAEFDIKNHPYILTGGLNKISVKVSNQEGDMVSKPRNIYYLDKQKPGDLKVRLFGLVIGVSDYRGNKLDLKYAAKDAHDIAQAIKLSANNQLGKENVHVRLMNTLQDSTSSLWPSKENIRQALTEIADSATARDILFIYMSGHGQIDKEATQDFYFLTADAGLGEFPDRLYRQQTMIANFELIDYIQEIAALKQVLVIDACYSGSVIASLSDNRSTTMDATHVRSLEKVKDHAGMYVLSGSAANSVSYESTIYGQGLLTYSLLMGMKGPALRDNQFVDILQLFNFASNEVPVLANEIGGIQKPEIKIPATGSFDIGKLDDAAKQEINVKSPKPIFIQSSFQHELAYVDILDLGRKVDQGLRQLDDMSDSEIVFINTNAYPGAFSVKGRYNTTEDNLIGVSIRLFKDHSQIAHFTIKAASPDKAKEAILQEVLLRLKPIIKEGF